MTSGQGHREGENVQGQDGEEGEVRGGLACPWEGLSKASRENGGHPRELAGCTLPGEGRGASGS